MRVLSERELNRALLERQSLLAPRAGLASRGGRAHGRRAGPVRAVDLHRSLVAGRRASSASRSRARWSAGRWSRPRCCGTRSTWCRPATTGSSRTRRATAAAGPGSRRARSAARTEKEVEPRPRRDARALGGRPGGTRRADAAGRRRPARCSTARRSGSTWCACLRPAPGSAAARTSTPWPRAGSDARAAEHPRRTLSLRYLRGLRARPGRPTSRAGPGSRRRELKPVLEKIGAAPLPRRAGPRCCWTCRGAPLPDPSTKAPVRFLPDLGRHACS